jgi:uncharacterized protein YfaS (alpha-2-macroglobulin family)
MRQSIKSFNWVVLCLTLFIMSTSQKCKEDKNQSDEVIVANDSVADVPITFDYSATYPEQWKVVDSLQQLGLYKSALDIVNELFVKAKKESNHPQVVKTIMHKMKFNSLLREDDFVAALYELDSITQVAEFPLKQIAHAITAEVYWGYYQSHKWELMGRTYTDNFERKDVRTWDMRSIAHRIVHHRMQSITEPQKLKQLALMSYKDMLSYDNNSHDTLPLDKFRPTLYDFLAFEAIDFFQSAVYDIAQNQDKYVLNNEDLLASNEKFIQMEHESEDSLSNYYYAVNLFQDLTAFHLNDKYPDVLIDITIKRLEFVKNFGVFSTKEERYFKSLELFSNQFKNYPEVTQFSYLKAKYLMEHNNPADLTNEMVKKGNVLAYKIASDAINRFPDSYGAAQCRAMIAQLERKSIDMTIEKYMDPGSNQLVKLTYTNVPKVYIKVLQLDKSFVQNKTYRQDMIDHYLNQGRVVQSFEKVLIDPKDYNQHSMEFKLEPMPIGFYVLLVGTNPDFLIENNAVNYAEFQITQMTFEETNMGDGTVKISTFNRETGLPISKAKVTLFSQKWNSLLQKYDYKKQGVYLSDSKGQIVHKLQGVSYQSLYVQIEHGNDWIKPEHYIYLYKDNLKQKETPVTHFFMDRKIYRPGQTIYFKGIVTQKIDDIVQVVPNKEVLVQLKDANYQKVHEIRLKTNEYGSYSGQFEAPVGVLTGYMSIKDNFSSTSFRVEEYKRPKFMVEFKPVTGVYKLNQEVEVIGEAMAYAGNVIDGATVNFRVTRSARFPYWYWYRYGYMPNSPAIEVASGTTTTDEKGDFKVVFTAKEDLTLPNYFSPIYSYAVTADVTDVNGETRSGMSYVSIGKQAMEVKALIDGDVEQSSFNYFVLRTANLNGQKVGTKCNVVISTLEMPKKAFRSRAWTVPEYKAMPEEDFELQFPFDIYDKENRPEEYKVLKEVVNQTINTEISDTVFIDQKLFEPGKYKIEVKSVDEFGTEVADVKYVTVFNRKSNQPATNEMFWVKQLKNTVGPGEVAEFILASASNIRVNYTVIQYGKILQEGVIDLNNEQKTLEFPITEKNRGSIGFNFTTYKANRYWHIANSVYVPFSNKELNISFETFRNKLLPGEEETWKIKLSGPKSELIAAEMVAALYDASLDEFAANSFWMSINYGKTGSSYLSINTPVYGQAYDYTLQKNWNDQVTLPYRSYPTFNWFGFNRFTGIHNYYRNYYAEGDVDGYVMDYAEAEEEKGNDRKKDAPSPALMLEDNVQAKEVVTGNTTTALAVGDKNLEALGGKGNISEANILAEKQDVSEVYARSNFNETAFFLPHLTTNAKGEIIFSFTMPESLTKWKFLGFAHTKDLMKGTLTEYTVTQKDIMVVPNAPRFFREKDQIILTAKISNMTDQQMQGDAQLLLIDPFTNEAIDAELQNTQSQKRFEVEAGKSTVASWSISIPLGIQAVTYKIVAKSGNFSDGEEMTLPVLSNRMLVTESLPLYLNKKGTKQFELKNLVHTTSTTLTHHNLTLEYSSNPAWYAIQALPYMIEYPYECSEQTFTRWYANSLAAHVANTNPKIKAVFDEWSKGGKESFISNLEKNQELKALFLTETPWVFNAQSELETKKRIGLLFDIHKMEKELSKALHKLEQMQNANGGWPWFKGFKENRYITQHIIMGFGHLNKLGVINSSKNQREWKMIDKAINYLDNELLNDYENVRKHHSVTMHNERYISSLQMHYLYTRSFFNKPIYSAKIKEAYHYYISQAGKYWLDNSLQIRAQMALTFYRLAQSENSEMKEVSLYQNTYKDIMKHLKEIILVNDEMGAFFKENDGGYYWENSQIETQSLMIEAFDEVAHDSSVVEDLKIWLLKQKQTTHWKTTKATAMACYALFMRGTPSLEENELVEIKLGVEKITPEKIEAGTGYYKKSWSSQDIKPEMGRVSLTKNSDGASWGALYWQYFEDLDKIKPHSTPLKINKQLFKVSLNKNGEVMTPISVGQRVKVGDKIRVRIEIYTDRNLEYVHLKDMRASGFEPVNTVSQYKYKNGLGYYEATKDASTNFFIDWLAKGTYVFEYDLRVFHQGDFSNGITSIQCMYAPEFTSHSEGARVIVE